MRSRTQGNSSVCAPGPKKMTKTEWAQCFGTPCNNFIIVEALVGAFNQEKAQVGTKCFFKLNEKMK